MFLVCLCAGLVGSLAWLIRVEIGAFSTATSDNLQYSLSQADVEFLRYELAIERAQAGRASVSDVRARFDVFYSRIATFGSGEVFADVREDPSFTEPYERIRATLNAAIPVIDASDEVLRDGLPGLAATADDMSEDVRRISLAGLGRFAEISDERRYDLVRTLVAMAAVLAALFAGLLGLAYVMYRLARVARDRAFAEARIAQRMQTVVNTAIEGIAVIDRDGRIQATNPSFERIFGYGPGAAEEAEFIALLFPDLGTNPELVETLKFLREGRAPLPGERRVELYATHRNGNRFPVELSIDQSAGPDDAVYVAYLRDVSRRRAAEASLTEARDNALAGERAKAKFLAVMSHEMRTPLNGLLGSLQMLRDIDLGTRGAELVDRMQTSGQLLLSLVNDVLDLSKYEAGKMVADHVPYAPAKLLDGIVAAALPLAQANGNSLSWHWVGQPVHATLGDPRRLRHVLMNLVGNAAKFTRGGRVEIECEVRNGPDPQIHYRVRDTGLGIPEHQISRVFEDFVTLDSSYARQANGTGLGLGIAKRMTRLMGGEIGVASEPGHGSTFTVSLPFSATGSLPDDSASELPERISAVALKVLLVEDNEINRFVAREMLEAEGHSVTEAIDGRAGVEWAEAQRFDVILMDVSMPVMDGTEAARRIRSGNGASRDVPIFAVTAHALPEEIERFAAAGMTPTISKPIDRDALSRALAQVSPQAPVDTDGGTEGSPEPPLFDPAPARVLLSLPSARRDPLIARFLAEIEDDMTLLTGTAADSDTLRQRIHKAAGSAGSFGLIRLAARLGALETRLKAGEMPGAAEREAVQALWAESRAALEDHLRSDRATA